MNETVFFFFFLECTFLHRILRIPLKSAASLHRSTGWLWPGQPAPWFCIKPAVKADDMQDRTQEEHTGELHFDLREYNFFYGFFRAHIFGLTHALRSIPQEASCRVFSSEPLLKKKIWCISIFRCGKEGWSCWQQWAGLHTDPGFSGLESCKPRSSSCQELPRLGEVLGSLPSLLLQVQSSWEQTG